MRTRVIAMLLLSIGWVATGRSQQIRIVVVEAQHGKPVSNECLSISFGSWHGTDILAPTNKEGVVVLSIEKDRVAAEPVPGNPCSGFPSTKFLSDGQRPTEISIATDRYVSCQYSKALVKDPAWQSETPSQRIPSFAVQEILTHGIVATNSCSKLNPTAKP